MREKTRQRPLRSCRRRRRRCRTGFRLNPCVREREFNVSLGRSNGPRGIVVAVVVARFRRSVGFTAGQHVGGENGGGSSSNRAETFPCRHGITGARSGWGHVVLVFGAGGWMKKRRRWYGRGVSYLFRSLCNKNVVILFVAYFSRIFCPKSCVLCKR